jgi:DNA-binding beta-propeller fold protein YncE
MLFPIAALAQLPGEQGNRMLLPNGWWLSPAGEQIPLGDFPMNAALSADERFLAVSHSGQSKAELWLVDLESRNEIQKIRLKDTWWGTRFVGDVLYVSGGYENCIYTFLLKDAKLIPSDTIVFASPRPQYDGAVAGIAVRGNAVACVFRQDSTLRIFDRSTLSHSSTRLDGMPYDCIFLPDGKIMVTLWNKKKAVVYEGVTKVQEFSTGDHPNEIALSDDGNIAYISCANDNTVSILDLKKGKTVASVGTAIHPDAPEGSTTNSVCRVHGTAMLLAANADNNSLTVIDVRKPSRPTPVGFIPVGWYPTKVMMRGNGEILVLNGKGGRSFANPKREYIAGLMVGSFSRISFPKEKQLASYSSQVITNTPYSKSQLTRTSETTKGPIPTKVGDPSPIKHVFYIIKENRTYDQVFGDMKEGNGDSSLCIFGEEVTPNHHRLAREFVLFDNFYVNSEVSADGHNWSVAGYATDFIEKTWPTMYGGRGGDYVFEGTDPTGTPNAGYLWTHAAKHGITFRSYGEFITAADKVGDPGTPRDKGLVGHFAPYYRGWDMEHSDVERYKEWEAEFSQFEKNGKLPQLSILHLPNDHTSGSKNGSLTPRAYVAQNDYALGLIVQRISKSSYWKESAIFVVEDDAQNGPDHVDAHRSVALVVSPYTRKGKPDHTLYTTTSMLRTMELILGMPPMSQYDAASTPMNRAFRRMPNGTPYTVVEPRIDILEKNKPGSFGQELMEEFDLGVQDAIPDRVFSEIIWQTVTGRPMPSPRYTIFSVGQLAENDEEEEKEEEDR